MVTEEINDIVQSQLVQVISAALLIAVGVNGITNPGTWIFTQVPVLAQIGSVLPEVVHQLIGVLIALGGITDLGNETGVY